MKPEILQKCGNSGFFVVENKYANCAAPPIRRGRITPAANEAGAIKALCERAFIGRGGGQGERHGECGTRTGKRWDKRNGKRGKKGTRERGKKGERRRAEDRRGKTEKEGEKKDEGEDEGEGKGEDEGERGEKGEGERGEKDGKERQGVGWERSAEKEA